jgi:dihydrofolate reductase
VDVPHGRASLPKYVVSSTLEDPEWNNSTVRKGDVVNEVSKLNHQLNGEIVVPGSFQLLRTLIEHDLVDELRLKIYPVVLDVGPRRDNDRKIVNLTMGSLGRLATKRADQDDASACRGVKRA